MAHEVLLLSSSQHDDTLPTQRWRIGFALRRTLRTVRLRLRVASYSRRVARQPESVAVLTEFASYLEVKGFGARAAELYARLALIAARRHDAKAARFCCLKLEHLGYDDVARINRDVAPVLAEAGLFDAAAHACRRVVEDYVAGGHSHAAAGYLKQLPQLGPRGAELLAEFTAIVTEKKRITGSLEPPASAPPAHHEGHGVFLTGTLGRITTYDVVQMVETNAVTGRLDVDAPFGSATIYFSDGRIVAARYRSEHGREAARQIFAVTAAPFRVVVTDTVPADEFGVRNNTGLLLDVLREADESTRARTGD